MKGMKILEEYKKTEHIHLFGDLPIPAMSVVIVSLPELNMSFRL